MSSREDFRALAEKLRRWIDRVDKAESKLACLHPLHADVTAFRSMRDAMAGCLDTNLQTVLAALDAAGREQA